MPSGRILPKEMGLGSVGALGGHLSTALCALRRPRVCHSLDGELPCDKIVVQDPCDNHWYLPQKLKPTLSLQSLSKKRKS